jgi:uncharacterized protein (DUF362 family)
MKDKISRKVFLKYCIAGLAGLLAGNQFLKKAFAAAKPDITTGRVKLNRKGAHDLVVARGDDPYLITSKAVEAMGGMGKFVKKGDVVVIKPNIGWDRSVEQAANTNPQVVAALIDLSFAAGAKRVNVFDVTCNDPRPCYENSGIQAAAKEKGANVYVPDEWNSVKAHFEYDSPMEGWPVLKDALECDTFINVPILKHHGLAALSISMKNLMGVCGGDRGKMHVDLGRKLVDLTDMISPDLTIIDAYRVLLRHGPTGGNLEDVKLLKTVIAATDPVLADAYAATLMGVDPGSLSFIKSAIERKLGSADIDKADLLNVTA